MARPPKPAALKLVTGNPGRRPIKSEPQAPGALKAAPEFLSLRQREIFEHAVSHAPLGLLRHIDATVLAVWAVAVERHEEASARLSELGTILKAPRTGVPMHSPYLSVMKQAAELILSCTAQLGFSPVARARLAVPMGDPGDQQPASQRTPGSEFFE